MESFLLPCCSADATAGHGCARRKMSDAAAAAQRETLSVLTPALTNGSKSRDPQKKNPFFSFFYRAVIRYFFPLFKRN